MACGLSGKWLLAAVVYAANWATSTAKLSCFLREAASHDFYGMSHNFSVVVILKLSLSCACLVTCHYPLWDGILIEKLTLCFAYYKYNPNKPAKLLPLPTLCRLARAAHSGFQTNKHVLTLGIFEYTWYWRVGSPGMGPNTRVTNVKQPHM